MTARSERCWVVDPSDAHASTMNLVEGFYRAKMYRDSGWSLVHAEVKIERDENGHVMSDVVYRLCIDGNFILDWDQRFPDGLTGVPITQAQYEHYFEERAWLRENWHIELGQTVDLTTLPAIAPPGM